MSTKEIADTYLDQLGDYSPYENDIEGHVDSHGDWYDTSIEM